MDDPLKPKPVPLAAETVLWFEFLLDPHKITQHLQCKNPGTTKLRSLPPRWLTLSTVFHFYRTQRRGTNHAVHQHDAGHDDTIHSGDTWQRFAEHCGRQCGCQCHHACSLRSTQCAAHSTTTTTTKASRSWIAIDAETVGT